MALIPYTNRLYWSNINSDSIHRIDVDGSGYTTLATFSPVTINPRALIYNQDNDKLYWTQGDPTGPITGWIVRASGLDTGIATTVFSASGSATVTAMAIDLVNDRIYIAHGPSGLIRRINYDGSNLSHFIHQPSSGLIGVAVDGASGYVYASWDTPDKISRYNISNSGETTILTGIRTPGSMIFDYSTRTMYCEDSGATPSIIFKTNMDNTNANTQILASGSYTINRYIERDPRTDIIYYSTIVNTVNILYASGVNTNTQIMLHSGSVYSNLFLQQSPITNIPLYIAGHNRNVPGSLLNEAKVVIYHPLNDQVEYTLSNTWEGQKQFVSGKVGSGITITNGLFGNSPNVISLSGIFDTSWSNFAFINPSSIVVAHSHSVPADKPDVLKLGLVSGYNIIWESGFVNLNDFNRSEFSIQRVNDRQFIVGNGYFGPTNRLHACSITVSGIVVSQLPTSTGTTDSSSETRGVCTRLDNSRVLAIGQSGNTLSDGSFYMRVAAISGNDLSAQVYVGPVTPVGSGNVPSRAPSFAVFPTYGPGNSVSGILFWNQRQTNQLFGTHVTISGYDIAVGNSYLISSDFGDFGTGTDLNPRSISIGLTDSLAAVAYSDNSTTNDNNAIRIISVSGNRIVPVGNKLNTSSFAAGFGIAKIGDSDTINNTFMAVEPSGHIITGKMITATNSQVSVGPNFSIYSGYVIESPKVSMYNPYNKVVIGSTSGFVPTIGMSSRIIVPDSSISYLSAISGVYPSMVGVDKVMVGGWFKGITDQSVYFNVEKGYSVTINYNSISLNNSIWNANISGILSNGNPHMIFAAFENQGGSNWNLYLSIDGSGWTNLGSQASGSTPILVTDSTPNLTFNGDGVDTNKFIDELVVYKNQDRFTDLELSNIYSLGNSLGEPLSNYGLYYGIIQSGSISLYMNAYGYETDQITLAMRDPSFRINTCTLFIQNTGLDFSWSIENFVSYIGVDPQLVGNLGYVGASGDVKIRIWELKNGSPVPYYLQDSGCYPIGDTGRWGFSTRIIGQTDYERPQYHYMMNAPNGTNFQGQFFMNYKGQRYPGPSGDFRKNIL